MHDMEKVLKALEHHKETGVCNGCPYEKDADTQEGYCPVYDDALALLREQETTPVFTGSVSGGAWYYICGRCKGAISPKDAYCRHCGKAVKWDERKDS